MTPCRQRTRNRSAGISEEKDFLSPHDGVVHDLMLRLFGVVPLWLRAPQLLPVSVGRTVQQESDLKDRALYQGPVGELMISEVFVL